MADHDRGYIKWSPTERVRAKLDAVQDVLATYHDHLPMTVRQIFYVLVARRVIEKTQLEYRNLARVLRKARRTRMIPFEAIHDQGSTLPYSLVGYLAERDLARMIRDVVRTFDLDPMLGQGVRLVVWCEAAGMLAQLERVAGPYGVRVISGGGYDSVSDKWKFPQGVRRTGAEFEVLHIGDLDRHGEDIFAVLAEDVRAFDGERRIGFTRLAVTEAQIEALDLESSVEDELVVQAEAIPPDVLAGIVEAAITERLDLDLVDEVAERSAKIRESYEAALRAAKLW